MDYLLPIELPLGRLEMIQFNCQQSSTQNLQRLIIMDYLLPIELPLGRLEMIQFNCQNPLLKTYSV